MKSTMFLMFLCMCMVACGKPGEEKGSSGDEAGGAYPTIEVLDKLNKMKVETSKSFRFVVHQEGMSDDLFLNIDAVFPEYKTDFIVGTEQAKADIKLDGNVLNGQQLIKIGKEYTVEVSNPDAVGDYVLKLKATDKHGRSANHEVKFSVYAPEITVKFYTMNIGFDEEDYYEDLNSKYTYSPLSEELKGRRVDTIYTREEYKSVVLPDGTIGYDSVTTTVPGQSLIFYVEQEGGFDFVNSCRVENTMECGWGSRIDGDKNIHLRPLKQGFHGIMFETTRHAGTDIETSPGLMTFTLMLLDKWGQEFEASIYYRAFAIDEEIPDYCTLGDLRFWWGHRIAD